MLLQQRLMGIALGGSLLLHAICAFLIPPLTSRPSLDPVETISFARVRPLQIVHHPVAVRKATPRPTRVAHTVLTTIGPGPAQQPHEPPIQAARVASVAIAQAVVGKPSPMPQPTTPATVAQQTAPPAQPVAGGYMPFGADEPDPVLDPKSLKQLQALGVHVTLIVTVGDDGKTKSVDFHPPLGPQLEAQVRALLVAANWDPAYCGGGVPCQKDASITL